MEFLYLIFAFLEWNIFLKINPKKDEMDALILVSQSPDYFMPPTSNVIQGKLGLKHDMLCMDINQGCAGFEIGLLQLSCYLIRNPSIRLFCLMLIYLVLKSPSVTGTVTL